MKILNWKSVSPLYEMERDGLKPFTTRKIDPKDKRFRALSQWQSDSKWAIRITNPVTGESFVREIHCVCDLEYRDYTETDYDRRLKFLYNWTMIIMGDRL